MKTNVDSWINFARFLKLRVNPEDIVFVHRTLKASEWKISAFDYKSNTSQEISSITNIADPSPQTLFIGLLNPEGKDNNRMEAVQADVILPTDFGACRPPLFLSLNFLPPVT